MVRGLLGAGTLALIVAGSAAAQRDRVGPECRRAIVALCGLANIGQCLEQRSSELSSGCRDEVSARMMARLRDVSLAPRPLPAGAQELSFGDDPRQRLDLFLPAGGATPAPVIVYVHGGGWSFGDKRTALGSKGSYFATRGYAFASVNYRLVPQATVEQQAADVASAIARLRRDAARLGIDPDRFIVMGHSAGAHLAALVATDPAYLRAAGVPDGAIRGAVLLDGAGYDVARQIAAPGNLLPTMYVTAFGTDPARQRALSPIAHAAAPNAPDWLILPVATRADSRAQSDGLAAALRMGGARVTVTPVPDSSHMKLNRNLGTTGDFATQAVDAFVAQLLRR